MFHLKRTVVPCRGHGGREWNVGARLPVCVLGAAQIKCLPTKPGQAILHTGSSCLPDCLAMPLQSFRIAKKNDPKRKEATDSDYKHDDGDDVDDNTDTKGSYPESMEYLHERASV